MSAPCSVVVGVVGDDGGDCAVVASLSLDPGVLAPASFSRGGVDRAGAAPLLFGPVALVSAPLSVVVGAVGDDGGGCVVVALLPSGSGVPMAASPSRGGVDGPDWAVAAPLSSGAGLPWSIVDDVVPCRPRCRLSGFPSLLAGSAALPFGAAGPSRRRFVVLVVRCCSDVELCSILNVPFPCRPIRSAMAVLILVVRSSPAGNSPFLIETPCAIPGARKPLSTTSMFTCIMSRKHAYLYLSLFVSPNIVYTGFLEPSARFTASANRTMWNDAYTPTMCRFALAPMSRHVLSHAACCSGLRLCLALSSLFFTFSSSHVVGAVYSMPASLMSTVSPRSKSAIRPGLLSASRVSTTDFLDTNSTHCPGCAHALLSAILSLATHQPRMKWTPPFNLSTHVSMSRAQAP